jgi:hypothetical protein
MSRWIFKSKGRPEAPRVFFGRAILDSEKMELTGWRIGGRYRETISLSDVADVEWWSSVAGVPNFRVRLKSGAEHLYWLESAGVWHSVLAKLLGEGVSRARLPDARPVRSAA